MSKAVTPLLPHAASANGGVPTATILCYPGLRPAEIAGALRTLAEFRTTAATGRIGFVALARGPIRLADGSVVVADHALADASVQVEELVLPASFLRYRAFATRGPVRALVAFARRAGRVTLVAASRQEAQRAHVLFRAASTWPSSALWSAFGPMSVFAAGADDHDRALWELGRAAA